jgi:signal peptidase I
MTAPLPQVQTDKQSGPPARHRSHAKSFIGIVVIVLFAITFIVQAAEVPTESMENTLMTGDYVLADKLHFGIGGFGSWLLPYRDICRGDIVVFHFPLEPSQYLVKRVVGAPGDHIRLHDGIVYVNGTELREDYAMHKRHNLDAFRDNFPSQLWGGAMTVSWRSRLANYVSEGEVVVPQGQYFVMGDNRDYSWDSRYWGFVPRENIVGRPLVVYLSVAEDRTAPAAGANDKLFHSGNAFTHLLQAARWRRMFLLVR